MTFFFFFFFFLKFCLINIVCLTYLVFVLFGMFFFEFLFQYWTELFCLISVEQMVLIFSARLNGMFFWVTYDDLNVNGNKIANQWVFGRQCNWENCCSSPYISMCPKPYIAVWNIMLKFDRFMFPFQIFINKMSTSCSVSAHIINLSSIYYEDSTDLFLMWGYIFCFFNCGIEIFVYAGTQIEPITYPIICK